MYINYLKYFLHLRIPKKSKNISDCDLDVYVNHLDKLREEFKIRFEDIDNIHVPERIVTPFDVRIENKGHVSDIEDELIEMLVDLEDRALS